MGVSSLPNTVKNTDSNYSKIMKLVASALAAASLAFTSVTSSQVWTSHSNYQACTNWNMGVGMGGELCTEKFFTVTNELVFGEEVAESCANIGAFPWCPESEEESVEVYANLAVLEYTNDQGNLDVVRWATDGISSWTGVEIAPEFNGISKVIENYVCPAELESSDGVMKFFWSSNSLDESIFNNEVVRDQERRCVALDDMSYDVGYAEMDMDAPNNIKNEIRKMITALRNVAIFMGLLMTFIFTGCCFCCCFCCCCKPCR